MEKYRQFAHAATGVNPFIPPGINVKTSLLPLRWVLLAPIAVLRLLIAAIMLVFLFAADCTPVAPLRMILMKIFARMILLSLGFVNISYPDPEYKKLRMMQPKSDISIKLFVSQYQSPCDILTIAFALAPKYFAFPCVDSSLKLCSTVPALLLSMQANQPTSGNTNLTDLIETKSFGQTVIFPKPPERMELGSWLGLQI